MAGTPLIRDGGTAHHIQGKLILPLRFLLMNEVAISKLFCLNSVSYNFLK